MVLPKMEQEIFTLLQAISIPGVFALAIVLVAKPLMPALADWIRAKIKKGQLTDEHRNAISELTEDVQLLGSNHLHEVKDLLGQIITGQNRLENTINRAVENGQRNQGDITKELIYIRARLNGKNH